MHGHMHASGSCSGVHICTYRRAYLEALVGVRMRTCLPRARARVCTYASSVCPGVHIHACLMLVLICTYMHARVHMHASSSCSGVHMGTYMRAYLVALVGIRMRTCLPRARARVCTYAHTCVRALGFDWHALVRSDEDTLYDGRGLTPRSSRACAPGLRACKKMETRERLCSLGPKVRNRGCRNLGPLVTALQDRSPSQVSRGPNPDQQEEARASHCANLAVVCERMGCQTGQEVTPP
jgi:hypothetical protein